MNTVEFLHCLFDGVGDGYVEVTYLAPAGVNLYPNVVSQFAPLPLGDINPDLPVIMDMNQKGYGAYFAPAVRKVRYEPETRISEKTGRRYRHYSRGKASDALYVTALWVDIDDPSQAAWDRLNRDVPYPSIIVSSGGGWHGYFLLNEPLRITIENHERVKRTLKGLALACGGDTAVADLARVMRLPGTINTKPSRSGVSCEVTDTLPARFQYAQFEMNFAPRATPVQPRVTRSVPLEASRGLPPWIANYLEQGASTGRRNRTLYGAAVEYNANGLSQMQAEQELGPRGVADGLDHEEVMKTIASAFTGAHKDALPNISETGKYKMAAGDHITRLRRNSGAA